MTSRLGSVGQRCPPVSGEGSGQGGMLMSDSHYCRVVTTSTSRIHPSPHTGRTSRQTRRPHCGVHTARIVTQVLDEYEWSVLEHSHYSPDFAPYDLWLFAIMNKRLRRHRFESEEDITFATKVVIRQPDKDSYGTAFESWVRRIQ
ncbi:histone-lysine N-methyltransferase SETMAR [Plakobranchus ocellatus]|uniref:Histone-lysine N-methyltransferase SETMAR n=1 Tax=Plakobranchus ocellatus TaxID=259542 RepID=A0AAV4BJN7_9GAST|nr:histone-lysine N-methyltransferase SETMAR [Plakobranchus ocellatus]